MEILFASIYKVSPFYTFVFKVSIVMGYCLKVELITMWMACFMLIRVVGTINEDTHYNIWAMTTVKKEEILFLESLCGISIDFNYWSLLSTQCYPKNSKLL